MWMRWDGEDLGRPNWISMKWNEIDFRVQEPIRLMELYWPPPTLLATSDSHRKSPQKGRHVAHSYLPVAFAALNVQNPKPHRLSDFSRLQVFVTCLRWEGADVSQDLPWLWRCRWCRRSHGWGCTRCARHCRSPHCCDNWAIDAPAADSPSTSELPPRRVLRPETRLGWSLASETQAPSSKALAIM